MQKATDITAERLAEVYVFPASDRPTLRANMVASIDGAANLDGRSGGLGGDGDHELFHLQRRLADVIVVGAQTAVVEGYRPAVVPLVIVSRSLNIPADYATVAHEGVFIATCAQAPAAERRRLLDAGATLIDCGDAEVDPTLLVDELAARGLPHILCEGGPRFLAAVTAAGLLDELALTVSPTMIGGRPPRIAHGVDTDAAMRLRHQLADDDGFLYQLWDRALPRSSHRYD